MNLGPLDPAVCIGCGAHPDRCHCHALTVGCITCGALPTEPCRDVVDHGSGRPRVHDSRRFAAGLAP